MSAEPRIRQLNLRTCDRCGIVTDHTTRMPQSYELKIDWDVCEDCQQLLEYCDETREDDR
jgi:phytoene/squalene synthetase